MDKKPVQFISNFLNEESNDFELSLDWELLNNEVNIDAEKEISVGDGLIICLNNKQMNVDINYISQITKHTKREVLAELRNAIFLNPEKFDGIDIYSGYETSDEYLSGNLKYKLKIAQEANDKYNGLFTDNIEALMNIIPDAVKYDEIYITLGSPWIPDDIIDDFVKYIIGSGTVAKECKCIHDTITGSWDITNITRNTQNINLISVYGTKRMNALQIIENTLNMRSIQVYDYIDKVDNGKITKVPKINTNETLIAIDKQKHIINEFKIWVWNDEERKRRLINIFDEKYASNSIRKFNGDFLKFPGMNPNIELYKYQKDAVARMISTPNTLLAHEVGTGKTYAMIAAGMELKRMGLSKKNMYLVPNNIVSQWRDIFQTLYPKANVCYITSETFKINKRQSILKDIRDNDYDAILIAYSCFDMIDLSLQSVIDNVTSEYNELLKMKKVKKLTENSQKRLKDLEKKLEKLKNKEENKDTIFFDELGITRLFVDEAHNYKNINIASKINKVSGLSKTSANKSEKLLDKVRYIQNSNNGGGIVFATGTPITNSLTDIYVIQRFLQNGTLTLLDLQNFDSWIGMFAEKTTEFEVDVDTNSFRFATRFTKFHNLPELTNLIASIADFHRMDKTDDVPLFDGYINEEIERSKPFIEFLNDISKRADDVRSKKVKTIDDNLLKITSDGRKAALDLRLVNIANDKRVESKVDRCINNVYNIFQKTKEDHLTQLVFCDISTPKQGFNIYDDIKEKLIKKGVPEEKIAYIHDAIKEKDKRALFDKVNSGDIRVLIGSTSKLGVGVNVQERLYAIHHLDVPWRPSDMIQREGRILRQGNINEKVYIYRYITKGSFDAYSWQLLETKQRFISSILSGTYKERSNTDVDEIVLSYAEVKALAIGNNLMKKYVETKNELESLTLIHSNYQEERLSLERQFEQIPREIKKYEDESALIVKDIDKYINNPRHNDSKEELIEYKNKCANLIFDRLKEHEEEEPSFENTCVCFDYFGFDIIVPIHSNLTDPVIYLIGETKYKVKLGDSVKGYVSRIDNRLNSLDNIISGFNIRIDELKENRIKIENQLKNGSDHSNKIEELKAQMQSLENMLGAQLEEDKK